VNDPTEKEAILTREELDALLASLELPAEPEPWRRVGVGSLAARSRAVSIALMRAMDAFGEEESRRMSNLHQITLRLSLIGWREVERWELAEAMLPTDKAVLFSVGSGGAEGALVIGRPLLFHLLALHFGAHPQSRTLPPPARPYTRIETRFYQRFARDLLEDLEAAWSSVLPLHPRITGVVDKEVVAEKADERIFYASFDVRGFGEVCRLRVALPTSALADLERSTRDARSGNAPVEEAVRDMEVEVHAELGTVQLPLSRLARLQVGEVLPLQTSEDGDLVVRVGETPKFKAVHGSVGSRAAIKLTERV